MVEVEVLGAEVGSVERDSGSRALPLPQEVRRLCELAAASAGVHEGHIAVEFVDPPRIAELNARYRGKSTPTDVLSFPVDGVEAGGEARELGDVMICPQYTDDVREAIIHGVLHLLGMDHEVDDGEMLALQRRLLERASS